MSTGAERRPAGQGDTPDSGTAQGYRILWTLCGVAIGVLVMLLAGLLARRTAKAPPQPAAQPA